jgi:hypothetical protein
MFHTEFIEFWKKLKPARERLCAKLAESASPCPDLSKRIVFPDVGALPSLLEAILINVYTPWNHGYWRDLAFEKIFRKARRNNFLGKWLLVREYLTRNIYTEEKSYEFLRKYFTTQDIFGNLLPWMLRLSRCIRVEKERPRTRVRQPRRKRGYDDKGTLLPRHKVHSCWTYSGPNPQKIEYEHRRPQHPKEWLPRTDESVGQLEPTHTTRKGGILDHEETSSSSVRVNRRENSPIRTSKEVPSVFNIIERRHEGEASLIYGLQRIKNTCKGFSPLQRILYLCWLHKKPLLFYGFIPRYFQNEENFSEELKVLVSQRRTLLSEVQTLLKKEISAFHRGSE